MARRREEREELIRLREENVKLRNLVRKLRGELAKHKTDEQ